MSDAGWPAELGEKGPPDYWRVMIVPVNTTNVNAALKTRAGLLFGWSISNASGAGTAKFYDGTDSSGTPVLYGGGASLSDSNPWFGPNGLWCRNGLYVVGAANVTIGSIFWVDLYD